mgnify:CR=1 FL=1
MKITKVIGYGLSSPVKSKFTYYGYQTNIKNIGIIEVHTDNGLVGFGETYAGVYCADLIEPTVKFLERFLSEKCQPPYEVPRYFTFLSIERILQYL